jgi:hypothetical protein
MYPAWGGSQSYMRVACIFQRALTPAPGDQTSATYTIHDFNVARYHNGAARSMSASAVTPSPSLTIPVSDCTSALGFINRSITGPGLGNRYIVKSITGPCTPAGTLNLNKATSATINPGDTFLVENSSVRQNSGNDATLAAVSPMITSASINFTAADNGLSVDGTNIPVGSTLIWPATCGGCAGDATKADISSPPTAGAGQLITVGGTQDGAGPPTTTGVSTNRTFDDASSTATTITSTAARYFNTDIGLQVNGPGITQPCYIASRSNTVATLSSACASVNAGPIAVTVGEPSFTAPKATDTVLNQAVQLPLSPGFVAGSRPCAEDNAAGFGIEGTWVNPGSFVGGAFATQPPNTKAIGEIVFTTSVISFGAYIVEVPAAPIGTDPDIGTFHYNIVWPSVPTALALCPASNTSPGLGFSIGVNGTTVSQAAIPQGQGRPATAQLRSTVSAPGGFITSDFITDDLGQAPGGGGVKWTGTEFTRQLIIPAGTPDINFVGGSG